MLDHVVRRRAVSCSSHRTDVDTQTEQTDRLDVFDCNICLDAAQEPVVTLCGHLYCWPCIYRWLSVSAESDCPVCKSPVSHKRLVPVYGRGKPQLDPRDSPLDEAANPGGRREAHATIPSRPHSRRPEHRRAAALAQEQVDPVLLGLPASLGGSWATASTPLGLTGHFGLHLPFGLHLVGGGAFLPLGAGEFRAGEMAQHHAFLSRLLLLLGSFIILCLLLF